MLLFSSRMSTTFRCRPSRLVAQQRVSANIRRAAQHAGAHCFDSWFALISLISSLHSRRRARQRRTVGASTSTSQRALGPALVSVQDVLHALEAVKARPLLRRQRRREAVAVHAAGASPRGSLGCHRRCHLNVSAARRGSDTAASLQRAAR